jgi:chemotaxis signal transduction protein
VIRKVGLFRIGNSGFAVPLERLLRIVSDGFSSALPLIPEGMAGILVLDNEIIPVCDSNRLSAVASGNGLNAAYKILIVTEYGTVALPADMTVGIVAENRCERVASSQEDGVSPGSIRFRDNLYQVLHIDTFMMKLIRP